MKQVITHGHPYVEIGGVKWATMNVGAKDVTDGGLYFAWGETKGYSREEVGEAKYFTWGDYKFGEYLRLYKYNEKDKLKTLQLQDDPVHVNWRGGWRLPTQEEYMTLLRVCHYNYTNDYNGSGVAGSVLTDKSDSSKELFFPAVGYGSNGSVRGVGPYGYCWSSSLYESNPMLACYLGFGRNFAVRVSDYRHYGLCARGVLDV